jgi:LuxR family maltose regulon positive regulatory protein
MLDQSGARIILLVAPAGYGKTTLAREWLGAGSRAAAWYHGSPASADVAALALGVAAAASSIIEGAGGRMRERLTAATHPDEDALALAEILADDLARWPANTWLVIDDYHFAAGSAPAEAFLGALLEGSPLQLLMGTRRRPSWASARRRIYGEILEIDRTLLAMTADEGRKVLATNPNPLPLLEQSQGWPAVIGMAAMTGDEVVPKDRLPAALYEYFAEELYEAADADTRWGLCQLAIPSVLTKALGEEVLGERLAPVLDHGTRLGIASGDRHDERIELHPLLRRFLLEKVREFDRAEVASSVDQVIDYLLDQEAWDVAFDVVREFGSVATIERLLNGALPSVLGSGRVATVQTWLDFAAEHSYRSPLLDFAEAELSVRQGLHRKAETLALQASTTSDSTWRATSFARAGRAAHLDGRPVDAIRHHRDALASSPGLSIEREALWGLCVALVEIEDIAGAEEALSGLDSKAGAIIDDVLRVASGQYLIDIRAGRSADARPLTAVLPLIDRSRDPMARSSFLNSCAVALTLNGRYAEAQAIATRLVAEAEEFRLRFVLPTAQLRLASVSVGQRRFSAAFAALEKAESLASGLPDRRMAGALPAMQTLVLLSAGEIDAALATPLLVEGTSASVRAEMMAIRGLALASAGDLDAAGEIAARACATSLTLEARSLTTIADAVIAAQRGGVDACRPFAKSALRFASDYGTLDHFVTGYRSFPDLLSPLIGEQDPRLSKLLMDAGDVALAKEKGFTLSVPSDQLARSLSPREREVFDLMASGLTNKEIATRLYISESTAKVHVRHIFEKLDAHTRTEAVSKGRERLT